MTLHQLTVRMLGTVTATAQTVLWASDIEATIAFLSERLSMRVDAVYPADSPHTYWMSGCGLSLQVRRGGSRELAGEQRLIVEHAESSELHGPDGLVVEFCPLLPPLPAVRPSGHLVVCRPDASAWSSGRAGMSYCDLLPDRFGGAVIASRIRVAGSGPVPDYVHHHHVTLQLIYCVQGAARLVYEDQGEPFVLQPGDCVLQPPHIRHRVLESWDDLEVLEISLPAEHVTQVDHHMTLPTSSHRPDRRFGGQRFARHQRELAEVAARPDGVTRRDLGIAAATDGAADVAVCSTQGGMIELTATSGLRILHAFSGAAALSVGDEAHTFAAGDTAVLPVGEAVELRCDEAVEWIDVHVAASR
jgi:quercetin dioxygenase-like cupin family protein